MPLSNSIVDHISGSWYTDEGVSITDGARNITVQHSIVGPGWNNPDGDGSQIEGKTPMADISVHHNLYIHNDARIPRVGEKEGPGVELDFRNNVIFNWNDSKAGYSVRDRAQLHQFRQQLLHRRAGQRIRRQYLQQRRHAHADLSKRQLSRPGPGRHRRRHRSRLDALRRQRNADRHAVCRAARRDANAGRSAGHRARLRRLRWWSRDFLDQRAIDAARHVWPRAPAVAQTRPGAHASIRADVTRRRERTAANAARRLRHRQRRHAERLGSRNTG